MYMVIVSIEQNGNLAVGFEDGSEISEQFGP